jgi:hypothetical protein
LHETGRSGLSQDTLVQTPPDVGQQALDPLAAFGEAFVGPAPELFQVPAQVVALGRCEWVFEQPVRRR